MTDVKKTANPMTTIHKVFIELFAHLDKKKKADDKTPYV